MLKLLNSLGLEWFISIISIGVTFSSFCEFDVMFALNLPSVCGHCLGTSSFLMDLWWLLPHLDY